MGSKKDKQLESVLRKLVEDKEFQSEFKVNRESVLSRLDLSKESKTSLMSFFLNVDAYLASYKNLSPTVGRVMV